MNSGKKEKETPSKKLTDERLAELIEWAFGGAAMIVPAQDSTAWNDTAVALRELQSAREKLRGIEAGTHQIVPRECPGKVWSAMRSAFCTHYNRVYLAPTNDEQNALRDVAVLDLYALALAAAAKEQSS